MKKIVPVLSITGSDSTGGSGVQADIMTITALGGHSVTAITSIAVQDGKGIHYVHDLPADVVCGQIRSIMQDYRPKAVKIGLVNDASVIRGVRDEVIGCPRIVCDPGILTSYNERLMSDDALAALCRYIMPDTMLLLLRCSEAELILGVPVTTDEEMLEAARRLCEIGAQWVLLRGGHQEKGRLKALLFGDGMQRFFTSYNVEGWQRHGVGGALSSAIATRLAFGDDVPEAVKNAHDYIHSQVVYAVDDDSQGLRPAELYNGFLDLIADNFRTAHDVAFYADRLAITSRYLSHVTGTVVGRSPKQIIDDYVMAEAEVLLSTTSLTIQEVSDRLGFSSQVMFSKFFRSKRGCTPSEFRK